MFERSNDLGVNPTQKDFVLCNVIDQKPFEAIDYEQQDVLLVSNFFLKGNLDEALNKIAAFDCSFIFSKVLYFADYKKQIDSAIESLLESVSDTESLVAANHSLETISGVKVGKVVASSYFVIADKEQVPVIVELFKSLDYTLAVVPAKKAAAITVLQTLDISDLVVDEPIDKC